MIRGRILLLVCGLSVFVGAIANQTEDKPAEQVYKNIQSFKGKPAKDIITTMHFMSASLGVGCDFCHVEGNFADESKEEKKTAREMIAMQNDINAKNFNGRTVVTCATCHNGHARPSAVPPVEGVSVQNIKRSDLKADDVLAKFTTAVGTGFTNIHLVGTTTVGDKVSKLDFYQTAPNKELLIAHGDKGDNAQAYNGTGAWMTFPGGQPRALPTEFNGGVSRSLWLPVNPDFLPKLDNPRVATAEINGKQVVLVRGNTPDGSESLYFDPDTGLLVRMAYLAKTLLGNIPEYYDYADYQKINGVEVPFTVTARGLIGTSVRKFTTSDTATPPAGYDMPSGKSGG